MSLLDVPLSRQTIEQALFSGRCFKNFKPSNTRNLRKGLARVRAGAGRMSIACLGDSTTTGTGANTGASGQVGAYPYSFPAQLGSILNKRLATTIDGAMWGQINSTPVAYGTFDTRVSLGAGWAANTFSISTMWLNNTTTNPLTFTPVESVDTVTVYYLQKTGAATFTINVDGGAALATVNASGAFAVLSRTVTFARGTHAINVARTGTGSDLFIIGMVAYDSATPSISVWNWGWHGATSTSWNPGGASVWTPPNVIPVIAPDVLIYGVGINDMGLTATATFKTNAQAIISAALTTGDCIIAMPNPVSTASHPQADQDAIRQALLELAATNDLPVIDRMLDMESYTQANASGWMWDGLHPNKLGYGAVASLIAKSLMLAAG